MPADRRARCHSSDTICRDWTPACGLSTAQPAAGLHAQPAPPASQQGLAGSSSTAVGEKLAAVKAPLVPPGTADLAPADTNDSQPAALQPPPQPASLPVITEDDVYDTVSAATGVPTSELGRGSLADAAALAARIRGAVVGQEAAVDAVCATVRLAGEMGCALTCYLLHVICDLLQAYHAVQRWLLILTVLG